MLATTRRTSEPLVDRRNRLHGGDGIAACSLFGLSLVLQSLVLAATPAFNGGQVIFGAPVADAFFWHQLAGEIAAGEGVKTPLRPLYSIVLASVFQFAGSSLAVAKAVNVVLGSASVAVSYLVFRFFAPAWSAAVFAAVLATSPEFVLFSHALLTEHAGLLFSMVALVGMLRALEGDMRGRLTLAGIATGLSNLARPLTLLATPFVAAAILLVRGRVAIKPLAIFFLVVVVSIAPWIVHQRIHYRISSLSFNSLEALYAATSPAYGTWTGMEAPDLIREGAISPGAPHRLWSKVYVQRILRNLESHPGFWVKNTLRMLWTSLNDPGIFGRNWRLHAFGGALLVFCMGAYFGWRDQGARRGRAGIVAMSIAVSTTFALIAIASMTGLFFALLLAGMGWALWANRAAAAVLIAYLLGNMASHSMFGFSTGLQRLGMMYEPLTLFLHLFGFYWAGRAGTQVMRSLYGNSVKGSPWSQPSTSRSVEARSRFEQKTAFALTKLAVIAAGLVLIASGRLVYLNVSASRQVAAPPARAAYPAILEAVAAQSKFSSAEAARALDAAATIEELGRKDPRGTLVIAEVKIPFSFIELPTASRRAADFAHIAYVSFAGVNSYWSLFCSRDLRPMLNRRFVAVARLHWATLTDFPETHGLGPLMRIIALVPIEGGVPTQSPLFFAYPCLP